MPGLYLGAILVSAAGIALLDLRFRLALWAAPVRTGVAIVIGTVFFLAWDAAGIAAGIFRIGGGSALLGIEIAPHLPPEEPLFLAFLCYLALVCRAAAARGLERRRRSREASS